jgi:small subunit ribosomal protein S20
VANHKDAAKRAVQAERRRVKNRTYRTRMRNQIQDLRTSLTGTDSETIEKEFREAVSVIQRLAAKGVIHRNQAARRVKRLQLAVNAKTNPKPQDKQG